MHTVIILQIEGNLVEVERFSDGTFKKPEWLYLAERTPKQVPFSGNAVMRHGGENNRPWMDKAIEKGYHELPGDEPVSDHAKTWDGWGTALKPSWEPIVIGYKPL